MFMLHVCTHVPARTKARACVDMLGVPINSAPKIWITPKPNFLFGQISIHIHTYIFIHTPLLVVVLYIYYNI